MIRNLKHVDRMTSLLLGAAIAALSVTPAAAQTVLAPAGQETETGEEIVVSGYRRSLEEAIDMKRKTTGFSDSIIATDIADFPEQNLSEALQRVPGVTIERERGLGTRVNVRGLPSEFTFVSINKLATASGSGGRDVEFDIFASELIQSVMSCPLLSGPTTMRVWIKEGTTNACEKA